MTATERAKNEIRLAGLYGESSDYGGMIGKALDELLDVFQKQEHSGFSAGLVSHLFHELVEGKVLSPLTGLSDEWQDQGQNGYNVGTSYQNKRMFSVFADGPNGENAHWAGRVFVDKEGVSFTHHSSQHPELSSTLYITFPCTPTPVYIHEGTPEAAGFESVFEENPQK